MVAAHTNKVRTRSGVVLTGIRLSEVNVAYATEKISSAAANHSGPASSSCNWSDQISAAVRRGPAVTATSHSIAGTTTHT
jgi:hypothetical protein